ncbi:MAG: hypothetical protein GXO26_09050 [Crenarchaeota archaeon]|nr:hypothetical protein [Thermoproteota archaeon]
MDKREVAIIYERHALPNLGLTPSQVAARDVLLDMIRSVRSSCIYLHTNKIAREVAVRLGTKDVNSGIIAAIADLLNELVEHNICRIVRIGKKMHSRGLSRRHVYICDVDRLLNYLLGLNYEKLPWECRLE